MRQFEFKPQVVKREVEMHTGVIMRDGERYVQLADYKKPQERDAAFKRVAGNLGIPLPEAGS